MPTRKIPATVITGFLGAGKSTLVRHVLENAGGRRIALIVNEFGDVGVDGDMLKSCANEACSADDIVELANGCICCTVADDFIPTMQALLARNPRPDHILIETSGLALPQPLIRAFSWPEVAAQVSVDGVIAVIDGPALAAGRFAHDEAAVAAQRAADDQLDHDSPLAELFEDQLRSADMVILNKIDLMDQPATEATLAAINGDVRPGAAIVTTAHGAIAVDAVLGIAADAANDMASRQSHHELAGEDDHDHDDFETLVVETGEFASRESLIQSLEKLVQAHDILRIKGFAAIADTPARLLVQGVGPRIDSYFDRPWRSGDERATRLVVIALKGLDRPAITAAIAG